MFSVPLWFFVDRLSSLLIVQLRHNPHFQAFNVFQGFLNFEFGAQQRDLCNQPSHTFSIFSADAIAYTPDFDDLQRELEGG